ncbi:MAG: tRNA pseudouridine(55) synthase TruB [Candidatus Binataceae bacterium]|nr:tRNA pseudouridine(55) synthase TruB [Candidatus Binataceae bacterium]
MPSLRTVHGVIPIDKPAGMGSAEVVRRVKRNFAKGTRVGHLGTLDPFATGMLPILIGEATKLAPFLQEGEKEYTGTILLGAETDTLDPTGQIVRTAPLPALDPDRLADLATRFTGIIEQTPPIFSALKRDGVRLYDLARRGLEVDQPAARRVHIKRLDLAIHSPAELTFTVVCSTGTYIRSLARDIGTALDSAAYLRELRRTRNGSFAVDSAFSLDRVMAVLERGEDAPVIAMSAALPAMPEVEVPRAIADRLRHGDSSALMNRVPEPEDLFKPEGLFKVVCDGCLIAVARATSRVSAILVRGFTV